MSGKFGKIIEKINTPTLRVGFSDVDKWISTGNYALNRLLSGDYEKGLLYGRNYVLYGESGCHAPGTKILMHDGTLKNVEDVTFDDKLMSPTGSPRTVISLALGTADMYRVKPFAGEPFVVNGNHVMYLSNGGTNTTMKASEVFALQEKDRKGFSLTLVRNCDLIRQPVIDFSLDQRMRMAVGIVDEYGKIVSGKLYVIVDRMYQEELVTILRSVGMVAFVDDLEECRNTSNIAIRIANDPHRLIEKYSTSPSLKRRLRKLLSFSLDMRYVGFTIERIGKGEFYGFELDGDRLYMTSDFIIHHNSGKSLLAATIAGNAQKDDGACVFWFDTEHATDDEAGREWLERAGVNVSDNFYYIAAGTLEDIKKAISKVVVEYRKMDEEDRIPLVFVIDSWAAAMTESQSDRTLGSKAGELVGDQGQKAKQTGDVILSLTHLCAGLPIIVVGVQHVMDNQDPYGRKHQTTGGNKMLFYASGCILMTKRELRVEDVEDPEIAKHYEELDNRISSEARKSIGKHRIAGISSIAEILKSRVSKPNEKVTIQIPAKKGIDPYSGLFHQMQVEGIITVPAQGWYAYKDENGEEVKFRKKDFREHADRIMRINSGSKTKEHGSEQDTVTDDFDDVLGDD